MVSINKKIIFCLILVSTSTVFCSLKKYAAYTGLAGITAFAGYKLYQRHQTLNCNEEAIKRDRELISTIEDCVINGENIPRVVIGQIDLLHILKNEQPSILPGLKALADQYNADQYNFDRPSDNGQKLVAELKDRCAYKSTVNSRAQWKPLVITAQAVGVTALIAGTAIAAKASVTVHGYETFFRMAIAKSKS